MKPTEEDLRVAREIRNKSLETEDDVWVNNEEELVQDIAAAIAAAREKRAALIEALEAVRDCGMLASCSNCRNTARAALERDKQ